MTRLANALSRIKYQIDAECSVSNDDQFVVAKKEKKEARYRLKNWILNLQLKLFFINVGSNLPAIMATSGFLGGLDFRAKPLVLDDANNPHACNLNFHQLLSIILSQLYEIQNHTSKATGLDKIPVKILQLAASVIAPSQTQDEHLQRYHVKPILKSGSGDRWQCKNYCPISR